VEAFIKLSPASISVDGEKFVDAVKRAPVVELFSNYPEWTTTAYDVKTRFIQLCQALGSNPMVKQVRLRIYNESRLFRHRLQNLRHLEFIGLSSDVYYRRFTEEHASEAAEMI
jgi:hypothetical protein